MSALVRSLLISSIITGGSYLAYRGLRPYVADGIVTPGVPADGVIVPKEKRGTVTIIDNPTTANLAPVSTYQTSRAGIDLIKSEEGLRLSAYRDSAGVWTIGYGHTRRAREGLVISQAQADEYLMEDIAVAEGAVKSRIKVPVTQGMFDALVSFAFNLGGGSLGGSTLRSKLNNRDYAGAAAEFGRWVYARVNGVPTVLSGLVKRRENERLAFVSDAGGLV